MRRQKCEFDKRIKASKRKTRKKKPMPQNENQMESGGIINQMIEEVLKHGEETKY